MNQRDVILQRIKKLMSHSKSAEQLGSLAEAETFMKKANELMMEYNLSLREVESTEIKEADEFKNWGYSERLSYDDKHQGWQWKMQLLDVITTFNLTSYTYNSRVRMFTIYGRMENVDMSIWLYNFMMTGLFNLAQAEYQSVLKAKRARSSEEATRFSKVEAYTFKRDFLFGAIAGIHTQMQKQREEQFRQQNMYALVKTNGEALSKFLHKTRSNVRSVPSKAYNQGVKHSNGYDAGYKAGLNFSVNKPLAAQQTKKQLS